ncbi:mitochondrial carrier [Ramicandelaber brevisporus]|nr:mitochondrial carrier [Ramicandelaber brevisporus]
MTNDNSGDNGGATRAIKDCLAGTVGGFAQVLVGQPFDITKVRLQTQPAPLPGQPPQYANMLDCVRKIYKHQGITGFYAGTVMPLLGVGACVSIQFASLQFMKRHFARQNTITGENGTKTVLPFTVSQLYLAGAASGVANSVISGPVEHVRIRLQVQTSASGAGAQFSGPFDCVRKLYSANGLRGVYQGQAITLLREFHGYGAYFMAYEWLVQDSMARLGVKREELPTWRLCSFGAAAGWAMWISCYPVDIIKSKIQTDAFMPGQRKYTSSLDCLRKTIAAEGVAGLFRGFVPCILRAAPANAATFVGFELAMRVLDKF